MDNGKYVRMTPMAPFRAITKDMMKNARATIPSDSRHVRPAHVNKGSILKIYSRTYQS